MKKIILSEAKMNHLIATVSDRLMAGFNFPGGVIRGNELTRFSDQNQVNNYIMFQIFQDWNSQAANFSHPWFDFTEPEVQDALRRFMNTVSKYVRIKKEDFRQLVEKAVYNTLRLILNPEEAFLKFFFLSTEKIPVAAYRKHAPYFADFDFAIQAIQKFLEKNEVPVLEREVFFEKFHKVISIFENREGKSIRTYQDFLFRRLTGKGLNEILESAEVANPQQQAQSRFNRQPGSLNTPNSPSVLEMAERKTPTVLPTPKIEPQTVSTPPPVIAKTETPPVQRVEERQIPKAEPEEISVPPVKQELTPVVQPQVESVPVQEPPVVENIVPEIPEMKVEEPASNIHHPENVAEPIELEIDSIPPMDEPVQESEVFAEDLEENDIEDDLDPEDESRLWEVDDDEISATPEIKTFSLGDELAGDTVNSEDDQLENESVFAENDAEEDEVWVQEDEMWDPETSTSQPETPVFQTPPVEEKPKPEIRKQPETPSLFPQESIQSRQNPSQDRPLTISEKLAGQSTEKKPALHELLAGKREKSVLERSIEKKAETPSVQPPVNQTLQPEPKVEVTPPPPAVTPTPPPVQVVPEPEPESKPFEFGASNDQEDKDEAFDLFGKDDHTSPSVNQSAETGTTLADRFKNQQSGSLNDRMRSMQSIELEQIPVHKQFQFVQKLFGGSSVKFKVVLDKVNETQTPNDAKELLSKYVFNSPDVNPDTKIAQEFRDLVGRRFGN